MAKLDISMPSEVDSVKPKFNVTDFVKVPEGFIESYAKGDVYARMQYNSLKNLFVNELEDRFEAWLRDEMIKVTKRKVGRPRTYTG